MRRMRRLTDLIETSVRALIVIGEDADNIESQLAAVRRNRSGGFDRDAVAEGFEIGRSGRCGFAGSGLCEF